ncbi:MAG: 50S ribosomal protein L1 [Pseudomonadota bacterium]|nr:50S ribosomal protein L1 [Pseudomonadota bacterium]
MATKLDQENKTAQPLADALKQIPELAKSKFVESVDVSLHLGVDPRKMMVRGVCHLPHGLGKSVKIAVFAESEDAKAATKAGANRVGMDDLAEEITADKCDYDVVIAHPNAMGLVGKLAKKLGPKGLMPNPKMGTVTKDVATAVTQALAGQAKFRLDKAGIIHCSIGRADFSANKLEENLMELLKSIKKLKPAASKGQYMQKLYLSTTMGKQSLPVDLSKLV